MTEYQVPLKFHRREFTLRGSRFISSISNAETIDAARVFIKEIKNRYPDATHNVPAFIIGSGPTVTTHCSDDGEPSGTAGRPILAVLEGSNLGDVVMVVTRYFGGTKLGTGGLVKAYTRAAKIAVKNVPKAKKISVNYCKLIGSYPIYEQIKRSLSQHQAIIFSEDFSDKVILEFAIPEKTYQHFLSSSSEISRGQAEIVLTSEGESTLVPIPGLKETK
jgi:uncharacterized YigZ family protein